MIDNPYANVDMSVQGKLEFLKSKIDGECVSKIIDVDPFIISDTKYVSGFNEYLKSNLKSKIEDYSNILGQGISLYSSIAGLNEAYEVYKKVYNSFKHCEDVLNSTHQTIHRQVGTSKTGVKIYESVHNPAYDIARSNYLNALDAKNFQEKNFTDLLNAVDAITIS